MNIEEPFIKATHTVAIKHLSQQAEDRIRKGQLGEARAMLADLRAHAFELIKYLDKRIVEER